ncbi:hypothetical protein FZEAL_600 [Fusarium zealandicum]|uniref:Cytochrome b561 domain-containing protein n=1 Tax=Fusarium zealandicum TaxID=1053134 RepID=A0A8H4XPN9_9HYPO|nr:hypothetical protein FZEAL_600 [Fusarium zealandicum]
MAPATDELSAPGAVSYDSNSQVVGDGTWDFSKNTFLLPNLQGLNYETMRYNGMGNRFSTLKQYHTLVAAHAVMGAMIFLFLIPFSVMTARFYASRPGWAVKYHAQVNIFAGLMLIAVFILGYFSVGPERSLTNPHHGIGVAIFALFLVQLIGGRLVRRITKSRSLRIMLHQWFGRAIALLGIIQVPLGLTLYGSPLYLFILYAVWMFILVILYFILSWRSSDRREYYMSGARSELPPSEATRTRVTESEYFASDYQTDVTKSKKNWLGPLAAGAGLAALLRGRSKNKNQDQDGSRVRSRSPSLDRSRGPHTLTSRTGSASYLTGITEEKYSEVSRKEKAGGGGGGFAKFLAILGLGKFASGLTSKKDRPRDEDYSDYTAVSTDTPRRYRSSHGAPTMTDFTRTDYTSTVTPEHRRESDITRSSLIPPVGSRPPPPVMSQMRSAADGSVTDSMLSSPPPTTPRASRRPHPSRRSVFEESDYSSYVSPSRRPMPEKSGGGFAKGLFASLGMGWFTKKMADRRAAKEEERLRDEEDFRSGTSLSRFTGDGNPSPTRKEPRRPAQRRQTGYPPQETVLSSEFTESEVEPRPARGNYIPPTEMSTLPPTTLPPASGHTTSRSRHDLEPVSMPPMPSDPHGILAPPLVPTETTGSGISPSARPQRSRQGRHERSASKLATGDGEQPYQERYASPASVSMKLKVHDDKDRNVTLRRLTEEEAMVARGRRDSESSMSGLEEPSHGRRRYRRDLSQRRAEAAAERRAEEEDTMAPLSPPNPTFAKKRRAKDSAYYSGQPGPSAVSGSMPVAGQTVSSLGSMGGPESHGTWSGMSSSPPGPPRPAVEVGSTAPGSAAPGSAAADNRRRRRLERRRASGPTADKTPERPSANVDMFD